MKKRYLSAVITCALLSFPTLANEQVIGGNIGYGNQDVNVSGLKDNSDSDNVSYDIYYRYMLDQSWGIEAGYHRGSAGALSALNLFSTNLDIDYKGYKLAAYGRYNLSQHNYLYGKLGANYHNVDYTLNKKNYDDSSLNAYFAAGWEYLFDSGLSLNIEAQHLPMDKLKVTNFNVGIGYHF